MKKILFLLLVFSLCIEAQEKTLIKQDSVDIGWFGAPVIKISEVNNDPGYFLGARGGVILGHHLVLGAGGYVLFNKISANEIINWNRYNFNYAYGGFEIEYIHKPNEIVHYTGYLLIGGGTVEYVNKNLSGDVSYLDDQFFVAEPGLNIEFNITKYFRLDAGVSYRFVSKVFFGDMTSNDLDGFTTTVNFKFGEF